MDSVTAGLVGMLADHFEWVMLAVVVALVVSLDIQWHRATRAVSMADAAAWTGIYIGAAFAYGFMVIDQLRGHEAFAQYQTAWLLEKTLSFDNLVAFALIFKTYEIKPEYQHKALHYGIIGAVMMRLAFVLVGAEGLKMVGWPLEVAFALIILWSAIKMIKPGDPDDEVEYDERWYVKAVSKILPTVHHDTDHEAFFVYRQTYYHSEFMWYTTPLFMALVTLELTDVVFAFDSVPAVLMVARDPLIVYSAMIFAVLGLRSMYFIIGAILPKCRHLTKAVAVILFLLAIKILMGVIFDIHPEPLIALAVTITILFLGMLPWGTKKEANA